jgi:glycosyltransferase involved in cell wall biosynthesis
MNIDGETPLVSVIIPTCGRPELLLQCVRSILLNDFQNFEIIVVDQQPGSDLGARLATLGRGRQLVHVTLDEAALDRARNLGIDHARGRFLVFADDDIEVDRGWLRAYVEAFTSVEPAPGAIAGRLDAKYLAPKPSWMPDTHLFGIYEKEQGLGPIAEGDLPIGANFALLADAVRRTGRFDERMDYSYARKSMLSGGDSLMALQVRQAGYAIYYQPAARAWHKISGTKLRPGWIIRRSYWDGVTEMTVLHLTDGATRERSRAIIGWHLRSGIGGSLKRFMFPKKPERRRFGSASAWMSLAIAFAKSLGTIRASWKLNRTGRLP